MEKNVREMKGGVKKMKELKSHLQKLEREWWRGMIDECEEVCAKERRHDIYKWLKKLGGRDTPVTGSPSETVEWFRDHFKSVSRLSQEAKPRVIEVTFRGMVKLTNNMRAIVANELLNKTPEMQEIMNATSERDTRDGAVKR